MKSRRALARTRGQTHFNARVHPGLRATVKAASSAQEADVLDITQRGTPRPAQTAAAAVAAAALGAEHVESEGNKPQLHGSYGDRPVSGDRFTTAAHRENLSSGRANAFGGSYP